jgi:hypothetical protein
MASKHAPEPNPAKIHTAGTVYQQAFHECSLKMNGKIYKNLLSLH